MDINNKINTPQTKIKATCSTKITYTIGAFSGLCFWLALYVFGYYFAYKDTKLDDNITDDGGKNYSISFSLANGSEAGMTVFFTLGIALLISLLFLRFETKGIYFFLSFALAITIFGLLISMVYYSPFKQNQKVRSTMDEHGIVAVIAFTLELIFNILIYVFMILNYRKSMPYLIILILIEIGFFLSLFVDAYYEYKYVGNDSLGNYFAIAENINYNFVVISIFLLGFL